MLIALLLGTSGCADPSRQQLNAGFADLKEGRHDSALSASEAFLAKTPAGPGSAEALYLRGRVFEARAEAADKAGDGGASRADLAAAGDAYARALRLSPSPAVEGLAHAGLANAAYHLDDYPTALREWQSAYPLLGDRNDKAWTLYRIGVCQQRLNQFAEADRTFAEVEKNFPNTEPALRSASHVGARAFSVQLGAFASPNNADREIAALRADPIVRGAKLTPSRGTDPATGRQLVRIGAVATYAEAKALQAKLSKRYPEAVILP